VPELSLHPTPRELADYGLGRLPDAASNDVALHLETCADCVATVAALPPDSFVGKVHSAGVTPVRADTEPWSDATATDVPAVPAGLVAHPKYRILRELGRGGMGVVYEAEHLLMGRRRVALKVIRPSLLDRPEALERFRAEAGAAGRLDHPNIVRAYDADHAGGLHFLVMEYVEGVTLAQRLERDGPLPVREACECVRQAALGLAHAAAAGMVHRDVKPQNLMQTPDGLLKVLDFGLAQFRDLPRADPGPDGAGGVLGTPAYMAPEQALDAGAAAPTADVYGLGCTLYALFTGRPPFAGKSATQMVRAHRDERPAPLDALRPDVPPALGAVVERMLDKDPARRYQSAADVAEALAPFAGGHTPGVVRRRRRLAAAAVALLIAGAGVWAAAPLVFKVKVKTPEGEAVVVLEVDRPGAEVTLDGETLTVAGDGKPVEIKVRPGVRRFHVSKSGFEAVTREVEIGPGANASVKIRLDPAPPPPPLEMIVRDYMPRDPVDVPRGRWKVEGGELVQSAAEPAYLFFGDAAWEDYDFEFEANYVSGADGFKALYRAADPRNYHAFGLSSYGDTAHEAYRVEDGNWIRGDDVVYGTLEKGRWHTIRVEVRGKHSRFYVNGVKLFDVAARQARVGGVGLCTWSGAARFRNLRVTAADGKTVLWKGLPKLEP
jgi:hypothetical protein